MRFREVVRFGAAALVAAASCWAATDYRLVDAVKRRDAKEFATLMAAHADVHAVLPDGATALAWAVFLDLPEMAGRLIDAGAEVNTAGQYGETPLTLALANRNVPLVEKLLKAGADPKAARWNGETSLMIAANAGSPEEVALLLDKGVEINAGEPEKGQNPLMWAAAEGHPEVVDLLIRRGANVNAASKSGFTPLVFATVKNDAASVKLLLKAGSDPNYTLPDKTKVLNVAATFKSTGAALALLDSGADPNAADTQGNAPLHLAAQQADLAVVKKLIEKGANVNALTAKSNGGGGRGGGGFFRGPSGLQTPLLLAARAANVDVMRALLDAGADSKIKAQDGSTLLLSASASGHVEAVKLAYEYDKDVKATDDQGTTAMHECVSGGGRGATQPQLVEVVQFLADVGAPIDELDKRGRTPIQAGDGIPLDKPIQRMADILVSRGTPPKYFPKAYIKPDAAKTPAPEATK